MTQICTCSDPKPVAHESGTPACSVCGLWWDRRYGSKRPRDNPNYPLDEGCVKRAMGFLKRSIKRGT